MSPSSKHQKQPGRGPPRRSELQLSAATFHDSPSELPEGFEVYTERVRGYYARLCGASIEELERELKRAFPFLRELLTVPFVEDRNGVSFTRFPASWLAAVEAIPVVSRIPAVRAVLDAFNDTSWCQRRRYEAPSRSEDILMCELQAGERGAHLKRYLEHRGRLEDLCYSLRLIPKRPHSVRPTLEWEPGDLFMSSSLSTRADSALSLTDHWGNRLMLETSGKPGAWRVREIEGDPAGVYRVFRDCDLQVSVNVKKRNIGELVASICSGDETSLRLEPQIDGRLESLEQSLAECSSRGNALSLIAEKNGVPSPETMCFMLPAHIRLFPRDACEWPLCQALRGRERTATEVICRGRRFLPTKADPGSSQAKHTSGDSISIVQRRGERIVGFSRLNSQSGAGVYIARDDNSVHIHLCVREGKGWSAGTGVRSNYQFWVESLEVFDVFTE